MASEKLLIEKIRFEEKMDLQTSKELMNFLSADWKITFNSHRSVEMNKRRPFMRLVQRAKIIFKCENLQRRVLVKGKIAIVKRKKEGFYNIEEFQHSFTEIENSYDLEIKMDKEIDSISTIISCDLEFYVSTENFFFFKFGDTFLPSLTDLEDSYLQNLKQVGNDWYDFFKRKIFTDVSLQCKSEVFEAHKVVLSSRSKVFLAMFQNPMKESEKDIVEIKDMTSDVLQTLLKFIYSGKIEDLSDMKACYLLEAAEKYDLKDLKKSCLLYLQTEMSIDNVLCILSFAEIYDMNLKKICIDFTCKEFDRLKYTEEWKKFEKEKAILANEVLYNMIDFVTQYDSKNNQQSQKCSSKAETFSRPPL